MILVIASSNNVQHRRGAAEQGEYFGQKEVEGQQIWQVSKRPDEKNAPRLGHASVRLKTLEVHPVRQRHSSFCAFDSAPILLRHRYYAIHGLPRAVLEHTPAIELLARIEVPRHSHELLVQIDRDVVLH